MITVTCASCHAIVTIPPVPVGKVMTALNEQLPSLRMDEVEAVLPNQSIRVWTGRCPCGTTLSLTAMTPKPEVSA